MNYRQSRPTAVAEFRFTDQELRVLKAALSAYVKKEGLGSTAANLYLLICKFL